MTEVEYVIDNFLKNFDAFRGKRIVLHGSRSYAEAIISNFDNIFHFVGILSLDPIDGEYFHGLKVLREEDLPSLHIDLVILTERVRYAVEAFSKIRRTCRFNGIDIYNMYGLNEFLIHRQAENAEQLTLTEAKELCSGYDMVAFEVMDTVIFAPELSARTLFWDLIRGLREQGKEIRFSLRKSFPVSVQIRALQESGLLSDVERELIYREGEDLSFRKLREENEGKKILYFGSGLANEFILPRYYGIDTCRFIGICNFDSLMPGEREVKKRIPFSPALKEHIENEILKQDLISFDIFDTLLVRKVLYPRDVFLLTELNANSTGYDIKGFAVARVQAEDNQPFCDIGRIYSWLEDYFGWDAETTEKIKALELEIEREVLVLRREVVELLCFARDAGKRIVLTSDMYLPESILVGILSEKGISGYEKILVSCDVKKSKHTGLFGELLKLCDAPDKILHIGDNPAADGTDCASFGIRTILIPTTLMLALERGWRTAIGKASNLMERCLMGLIVSKLFCNPFQNPNFSEWSSKDLMKRLGTCVSGSLTVGHLTWLIGKLREAPFAGVLFLARDGWLSYNVYEKIRTRLALPLPVYYYANRHSAFLCCADSETETAKMTDIGTAFGVNVTEILKRVYQIPEKEMLPRKGNEGVSDYIEKHMSQIRKNAVRSREGYLRYSEKCGLQAGCSYAVVDFIAVGKTQKYLSTFVPFCMQGFYFGNYSPSSAMNTDIEYYLKGDNPLLLQRYIELEPFFSSPEPSQSYMTEDGTPVFGGEIRSQKELEEVETVIKSAEDFSLDFFHHFYCEGQVISPALVEEIYAAEDYYTVRHKAYDDWLGVQIRQRKTEESKKQ